MPHFPLIATGLQTIQFLLLLEINFFFPYKSKASFLIEKPINHQHCKRIFIDIYKSQCLKNQLFPTLMCSTGPSEFLFMSSETVEPIFDVLLI
jgi:hypothetical protein